MISLVHTASTRTFFRAGTGKPKQLIGDEPWKQNVLIVTQL
jgi:hypothetical protein